MYVYDLKSPKSLYQVTRVCNHTEMFISGKHGQIHVGNSCGTTISNLKPWTLEEADDNEWVLAWDNLSLGSNISSPTIMTCTDAREGYDNVVPYIGQTPEQLGLET